MLSFAAPRVRYALSESRSLGVERKEGCKLILKLNDFEKESLKVPEIAGREVSWTSFAW